MVGTGWNWYGCGMGFYWQCEGHGMSLECFTSFVYFVGIYVRCGSTVLLDILICFLLLHVACLVITMVKKLLRKAEDKIVV